MVGNSLGMPIGLDLMKQADEAHEIEVSKLQDNRRLKSQDLGDWALELFGLSFYIWGGSIACRASDSVQPLAS